MPTDPGVETLRNRARQLRREQTEAEKRLWAGLRARQLQGYKFRRQFVIGSVIVDFCCFEKRIVVELDGGQHAEQEAADQVRSWFLYSRGYRVLRFWNNEIDRDLDGVLTRIDEALRETSPPGGPSDRHPPPSGEG